MLAAPSSIVQSIYRVLHARAIGTGVFFFGCTFDLDSRLRTGQSSTSSMFNPFSTTVSLYLCGVVVFTLWCLLALAIIRHNADFKESSSSHGRSLYCFTTLLYRLEGKL